MALSCTCNKTLIILVTMGLTAAMGVLLLFVGCAMDFHTGPSAKNVNWWGLFVLLFYLLAPIPLALARRCVSQDVMSTESLNIVTEVCYFLSACIVVSGFGLPFILARRQIIQSAAAALIAGANIFAFGTIYSFFVFFGHDDDSEWTNF